VIFCEDLEVVADLGVESRIGTRRAEPRTHPPQNDEHVSNHQNLPNPWNP
jgi:hypothetical protein